MKTLRLNTFPARYIDNWNNLPDNLVCSKSVDTFKKDFASYGEEQDLTTVLTSRDEFNRKAEASRENV